jgi:hypothetical protein
MTAARRKRAEKKKKKNPGINPGQPAWKGREKKKQKTLVLTLGSPPEKGGRKRKKPCPSIGRGPETWRIGPRISGPRRTGEKKKQKTCSSVSRGPETWRTGPRISRPVLPRNIVGRTGRFCRGTSSDGQTGSAAERHVGRTRTALVTLYIWFDLSFLLDSHHNDYPIFNNSHTIGLKIMKPHR